MTAPRYAGRGFRNAVQAALPDILTKLAPLLDTETPGKEQGMEDLAVWCHSDPVRTVALIYASLEIMHSHEVTPGVVREWSIAARRADIRAHKNPIVDRRVP